MNAILKINGDKRKKNVLYEIIGREDSQEIRLIANFCCKTQVLDHICNVKS